MLRLQAYAYLLAAIVCLSGVGVIGMCEEHSMKHAVFMILLFFGAVFFAVAGNVALTAARAQGSFRYRISKGDHPAPTWRDEQKSINEASQRFARVVAQGDQDAVGQMLAEMEPGACDRPPPGWWCSRKKGHAGPCAARQLSEKQSRCVNCPDCWADLRIEATEDLPNDVHLTFVKHNI